MHPALCYVVGRQPACGETFVAREIDALRRRGWRLDVVALDGAEAIRGTWRGAGDLLPATLRAALPCLAREPRLLPRLLRRLPQTAAVAQRVRSQGSELIHAHFAWLPADLGAIVARHSGLPFTCSVHAWDLFAQPPAATRRRLASAAAICACSTAARQAVLSAGLPSGRVHLVHHGLPLESYPFEPARPPHGDILAVGRLEPKKGFDLLIEAIARLPPGRRCRIIGEGSERSRLERQITAQGLSGRVVLGGAATAAAVREAMRRAGVLVLPSRRLPSGDRDGIANVLLEAMALGTPVVTTTAGAAGEVVEQGKSGWLVPVEDPAALAQALAEALDDGPRRDRCVRSARAIVEASFDAEVTTLRLEQVFQSACVQAGA